MNYAGQGRTNYFRVKDADEFKAWASAFPIRVIERDKLIGLVSEAEDGSCQAYNEETDTDRDALDELTQHLADGEVMMTHGTKGPESEAKILAANPGAKIVNGMTIDDAVTFCAPYL